MKLSICFLAGTPFSFYPGRFQMLAIELAARGHDVTYFAQPKTLKDAWLRYRRRGMYYRTAVGGVDDPRTYRPGVQVHEHAPLLVLPFGRFGAIAASNAKLLRVQVKTVLATTAKPRVAVVFMPEWLERVGRDDFDVVVYDVPDDLKLMTTLESPHAERAHLAAIAASDLVTVTANAVLRKGLEPLVGQTPLVELGNGVDFEFFARQQDVDTSAVLPHTDGPTIGFVGAIHHWVDLQLVRELALRLPHVRVVLVGNLDDRSRATLDSAPLPANLVLLGRQPKALVPALMKRFGVGLIPFHEGPIADATDPIKIYEYFAVGRPVVATPMPSLGGFAQAGLLQMVSGVDAFTAAVTHALADPGDAAPRIAAAANASWQQRAVQLETLLFDALARRSAAPRRR